LKTSDEIENVAIFLVKTIQELAKVSSYTNTNQPYKTNNELLQNICQLITLKRRIRTRWQLYRYLSDKLKLNQTTNILKNKINQFKPEQYQLYLKKFKSTKWLIVESTKKLNQNQGKYTSTSLTDAKQFQEIFKPYPGTFDNNSHYNNILKFLDSPLSVSSCETNYTR